MPRDRGLAYGLIVIALLSPVVLGLTPGGVIVGCFFAAVAYNVWRMP